MALTYNMTSASEHESKEFEDLLDKKGESKDCIWIPIMSDKKKS